MPDRIRKVQRWMDLIALLVGRRIPLTAEEIMERVPAYHEKWSGSTKDRESVRRTFERDKDELRELGIPLHTVTYRINYGVEELEGYRLDRADFYLPYLRLLAETVPASASPRIEKGEVALTEEEVQLAVDSLQRVADLPAFPFAAEARSAFRKLAYDLDLDRFAAPPVIWLAPPEKEEVRDRLRLLSRALFTRKRITFRYHGIYRGETTDRDVAPYGLFFQRDWYLVGHDAVREAVRVFRVARMEEVLPNPRAPKNPDYEIPPGFRVDELMEREAWELGGEEVGALHAAVRFTFPFSIQAEHFSWGDLIEEHPDGSTIRRFEVRQPDTFLRWILSHEGEADVVSPPELRGALTDLAREIAALYSTEPTDA
jgi:predicted DNA-binding transcriptional regulator YafY